MLSDSREKELRNLAKEMVWIQEELKKDSLYEEERDNCKEESYRISKVVVTKGYSVELFMRYIEDYKNMTYSEYRKLYLVKE